MNLTRRGALPGALALLSRSVEVYLLEAGLEGGAGPPEPLLARSRCYLKLGLADQATVDNIAGLV